MLRQVAPRRTGVKRDGVGCGPALRRPTGPPAPPPTPRVAGDGGGRPRRPGGGARSSAAVRRRRSRVRGSHGRTGSRPVGREAGRSERDPRRQRGIDVALVHHAQQAQAAGAARGGAQEQAGERRLAPQHREPAPEAPVAHVASHRQTEPGDPDQVVRGRALQRPHGVGHLRRRHHQLGGVGPGERQALALGGRQPAGRVQHDAHPVGGQRHQERAGAASVHRRHPAQHGVPVEQAAAGIVGGVHLQHQPVDRGAEGGKVARAEPVGQDGDGQEGPGRQLRAEDAEQVAVGARREVGQSWSSSSPASGCGRRSNTARIAATGGSAVHPSRRSTATTGRPSARSRAESTPAWTSRPSGDHSAARTR